jgi:hypothetical protein
MLSPKTRRMPQTDSRVIVCPSPQTPPLSITALREVRPALMATTAARWSASNACCIPTMQPSSSNV